MHEASETTSNINPDTSYTSIDTKKATKFRILAILLWLAAITFEILAIIQIGKDSLSTNVLITYIILDLVTVVVGSLLWKKANRYNPASKKQRFKFFLQNQLGLIIGIIAFLPLILLIFKSDNLDGKQKRVIASVAIIAVLIAGLTGIDFNPPSQEQYLEETERVKSLNNGRDYVYWTKSGSSFHLFEDCSYINSDRTIEIFEGTVVQAKEMKNISDLCDRCQRSSQDNKNTLDANEYIH